LVALIITLLALIQSILLERWTSRHSCWHETAFATSFSFVTLRQITGLRWRILRRYVKKSLQLENCLGIDNDSVCDASMLLNLQITAIDNIMCSLWIGWE